MSSMKRTISSKVVVEKNDEISLLDLPELTLECILERLSPAGLYAMSGVCSSMRNRCGSDHLWEKHVNKKWGKLIGNAAAYREWQWQPTLVDRTKQRGLFGSVSSVWPLSWITPTEQRHSSLPVDSVMDLYIALESGKLWFPAQVYNRENGYVGFMLSSYDAEVSYDSCTDTFRARYSPHWQQTTEENIVWNRLRARTVDTLPHVLHVSDCLNDLSPGDHIEIQWRRKKEFPYGWWYGVVAHLESCNGNKIDCRCHSSEKVILEFKQYSAGSQWGKTVINRKEHREIGNEADGFYGGIRKLYHEEEISMWRRLWPPQLLE
ncbi:hypothetical protein F0562_015416 [Nyssa sinensis]|uniref:F-box domain-containing protein n=1 Tax=Nyssa sinensis TaxID=561372 RepID=A0A5J4ZKB9_9ASTE|nr:hypothetical protein F0562_015416 [Nyssa sinensis]